MRHDKTLLLFVSILFAGELSLTASDVSTVPERLVPKMEVHQRLERIKRLVHGPRHGPQQHDPKVGIVEREEVVVKDRAENLAVLKGIHSGMAT